MSHDLLAALASQPCLGDIGDVALPQVLRAEFSDLIKGFIILVFILGPVLRKLLEGFSAKAASAAPPLPGKPTGPRRRQGARQAGRAIPGTPAAPASGAAPTRRDAPFTWEDLMRGDVPELPPQAPDPEPDWSDAPTRAALEPESGSAERVGLVVDPHVWDRRGLPSDLRDGEDLGDLQVDRSLDSGRLDRFVPTGARRRLARMSDWRRAIVLAEVLAPPLALREQWSHPGPPLGPPIGRRPGER